MALANNIIDDTVFKLRRRLLSHQLFVSLSHVSLVLIPQIHSYIFHGVTFVACRFVWLRFAWKDKWRFMLRYLHANSPLRAAAYKYAC